MIQSVLEVHDYDKLEKWGFKVKPRFDRDVILEALQLHFENREWIAYPIQSPNQLWYLNFIWFKDEEDALLFKLTWS